MAEQIEINIYLKDGNGASDGSSSGQDVKGMSNTASTQSGNSNGAVDLAPLGKYLSSQILNVFLEESKTAITSNIGLVTGKTELQQKINWSMSAVQQGVNIYGSAVAGGAVLKSMGLKSASANTIAAVVALAGYGLSKVNDLNNYNLQKMMEDRRLRELNTRAGASVNRSRSGY